MRVDLRLYAIVDPQTSGGHDVEEIAGRVVAGGATLVQLRDKVSDARTMVAHARAIKAEIGAVPLLINDRVDVALAADCEGVHLGQEDMAVEDARRLLGRGAIIGLSIKTIAQAAAAPLDIIDYAGIGGVFGTTSKQNTSRPIGPEGLKCIIAELRRRKPDFPTCGIAGINESNAAEVITAGADGISVISALSLALDPKIPARRLREIVDAALAQRGRG